ncbi:MAG: hypothetical protein M1817_002316 [Caeruleum heppii]|nr:MAG: hypothetical protein M1817_003499 [Caeruleum heppii]KAI9673678.1 MAG: hypothetical protein M1817_002316 [Caeruleum heppii]
MAGMEQLEIHSKSYLVRWVNVPGDHTISWSIRPNKKSINFGLFKHPGGVTPSPNIASTSTFEPPLTPSHEPPKSPRRPSTSKNDSSTAAEKLKSIGLTLIAWIGKCEPDQVETGKYNVRPDQAGMYALVFDNTFSKQVSKTATFALLTYPTKSPPQTTHHLHHLNHTHHLQQPQTAGSSDALGTKTAPSLIEVSRYAHPDFIGSGASTRTPIGREDHQDLKGSGFYTGILWKRRRKRHQGYARRFFSLNFTSATLSYYHNRRSFALRGAIPLALAAVGANEQTQEISVDSGAEVWHLRAGRRKDFQGWKDALEKASGLAGQVPQGDKAPLALRTSDSRSTQIDVSEERDWARVETLVGRVSGTRDAIRRLEHSPQIGQLSSLPMKPSSAASSPSDSHAGDYFGKRRPFWKRKASSPSPSTTPAVAPRSGPPLRVASMNNPSGLNGGSGTEGGASLHRHCQAILNDLDAVIADFSTLIIEHKRRRMPVPVSAMSRLSMDSMSTGEFYDAEDGDARDSQLLVIRDSEVGAADEDYSSFDEGSESSSDIDSPEAFSRTPVADDFENAMFPPRPKALPPLPVPPVQRRRTIPPAKVLPPSLIGFLRKNVGKDLSTIAMPVSANEPTSLLQRVAEQLEYISLLESACTANRDTGEQLLYVTAFAISAFSNVRVKERAIRKPFNPLLGETFELVREDRNLRFIAEKVSHRPVRMACQAESPKWSFTQSPMPTQKFWGKSAELNTDGRIRVVLHDTGDHYSWTSATCFLRNIIAGEKYVEPVGSMTVVNETTGQKAVVTFKAKGMFSGRSEDVVVQTYGKHGDELSLGLTGKWTTSLSFTDHGGVVPNREPIWGVGDLVPVAASHYGLTSFAATLNEITSIEQDMLAPTDSRVRPDQRLVEEGDLDRAEEVKAALEQKQRERRKVMEEQGRDWVPRWFEKVDDGVDGGGSQPEEVWKLKGGKEGYWERRERRDWGEVVGIFDV